MGFTSFPIHVFTQYMCATKEWTQKKKKREREEEVENKIKCDNIWISNLRGDIKVRHPGRLRQGRTLIFNPVAPIVSLS